MEYLKLSDGLNPEYSDARIVLTMSCNRRVHSHALTLKRRGCKVLWMA